MSAPVLCPARRREDSARCVLNEQHSGDHAYATRLDLRLGLLDSLAETFRKHEEWAAYHHVRAVAHGLGFHLTSCVGGRGVHYEQSGDQRMKDALATLDTQPR